MKTKIIKTVSFIICLAIISSTFLVNAFAAEEINYNEYFSDTVMALLNGEKIVNEIYGAPMSYDLNVMDYIEENPSKVPLNDPAGEYHIDFESLRDNDKEEYPTHQRITAMALAILLHDKGSSVFNQSHPASIDYTVKDDDKTYTATLADYTDWMVYYAGSPDEDETGNYSGISETGRNYYTVPALHITIGGETIALDMYSGHFYNPYTEKNFRDVTTHNAKINARRHFDVAVSLYNEGRVADALDELGRGCHYCQDACQPHHANNITAADDGSGLTGLLNGKNGTNRHAIFEKDIDTYIRNHLPYQSKLQMTEDIFDSSIYSEALTIEMENIVRNNSYSSYVLVDRCDYQQTRDVGNTTDYYDSATASFKNATISTLQYIYKFANTVGITFTK